MAEHNNENLTEIEGLIKRVEATRRTGLPRSENGTEVVVLERLGNGLTRYIDAQNKPLTIPERIWGKYIFCIVDTRQRRLKVEDSFTTKDKVYKVDVAATIQYQVSDAKKVVVGVEDPLGYVKDHVVATMRTEIANTPIETLDEQKIKNILSMIASARLGDYYPDVGITILGGVVTKFKMDEGLVAHLQKLSNLDAKREIEKKEFEQREEILSIIGLQDDPIARFIIHSKQEDIGRLAQVVSKNMEIQGEIDRQRYSQYIELFRLMLDNHLLDQSAVTELVNEITTGLKNRRHDQLLSQALLFAKPKSALESGSTDAPANPTDTSEQTESSGS